MEITEKLDIFYSSAIDAANKLSSDDMLEYKASMEKQLDEYAAAKKEELYVKYRTESAKMRREVNRRISEELTERKRQLSQRQQEKKDALFDAVEQKLAAFRKTLEYDDYLVSRILAARKFANGEEIVIYLDPEDASKQTKLEIEGGGMLMVSKQPFGGGIKAEMRSRNILIDESFETLLQQEREAYTF